MNSFSIYLALGVGLGLALVARAAPPAQAVQRVNLATLALFGALGGARMGYVALLWGYYRQHPAEIAQVWLGGLSLWGALAGAVLTLVLCAVTLQLSFARLADVVAPLLPALGAAGWLGCSLAGCAYGVLAPAGAWWGLPGADETGLVAARLPLAELAALSLLLVYGLLAGRLSRAHALHPGLLAALYGLVFGLHTLIFSLWVTAPGPRTVWGLLPGGLAALVLAVVCVLALLVMQLSKTKGMIANQANGDKWQE